MKNSAQYSVSFGLSGCYLPDSQSGPYQFDRRKDLADFIRHQIEFYDLPKYLLRDVKISRLWSFIKRHGSSSAHFSLHHKGFCLSFHGLTNEEFSEMEGQQ